jgi:hypothetical protein
VIEGMIKLTQKCIKIIENVEIAETGRMKVRLEELKWTLLHCRSIESMRDRWKELKGQQVGLQGEEKYCMALRLQANEAVARIMLGKSETLVDTKS